MISLSNYLQTRRARNKKRETNNKHMPCRLSLSHICAPRLRDRNVPMRTRTQSPISMRRSS